MLAVVLVLLIIAVFVLMFVGLFKPSLVIRWGNKRSRPRVLMIYGSLFIGLFIALGSTTDNSEVANKTAVKFEEQAKAVPNKVEAAAATNEVKPKYDHEGAKNRIMDWLGEHEFPVNTKLDLNDGTIEGKLFEFDGNSYHRFVLVGLKRAIDILVDSETGDIFYHDIGIKPQSLDKWYLGYKVAHKAEFNNVINENFIWVEKPRIDNGAVVGKVKNISGKEFKNVYISFNCYDANKNRIGTLNQNINNLKPGDVWKFAIPIYVQNVASYELADVEAYTW